MPKNPDLPILFAKSVLSELANISATLHLMSEIAMDDFATRTRTPKTIVRKVFREGRDSTAEAHLELYMRKLGFDQ
jgi:hypothetical protein